MTIAELLEQARQLSYEERVALIKGLVDLLAPSSPEGKRRGLLEYEGVASRLADDEDPQAYIDRLRRDWDEA